MLERIADIFGVKIETDSVHTYLRLNSFLVFFDMGKYYVVKLNKSLPFSGLYSFYFEDDCIDFLAYAESLLE